MRERHPFKWMTYKGEKVRIDREIAPLLEKMWKLGIGTTNSCQAHCNFTCKHKWVTKKDKYGQYDDIVPTKHCHNCVWLAFESVKDVEKLYNLVAEYVEWRPKEGDNAMYFKMSCDRFLSTGQTNFRGAEDRWSFSFLMRNHGVQGHFGRPLFNGKRSTQLMWIEDKCEKNDFVIEPQITFPRAHLPYVHERLDQALKRRRKS